MVHRDVSIVPGLYKIFDEILVNAADNKVRDPAMNELRVEVKPVNALPKDVGSAFERGSEGREFDPGLE